MIYYRNYSTKTRKSVDSTSADFTVNVWENQLKISDRVVEIVANSKKKKIPTEVLYAQAAPPVVGGVQPIMYIIII